VVRGRATRSFDLPSDSVLAAPAEGQPAFRSRLRGARAATYLGGAATGRGRGGGGGSRTARVSAFNRFVTTQKKTNKINSLQIGVSLDLSH